MKMAKADSDDFETAFLINRILDAAERGSLIPDPNDEDEEWPELDPDRRQDLRKFFDLLMNAQEKNPAGLMRVIGCAHTLMDDSNRVVDPDKDYIDFHPRFAAVEQQRDELLLVVDQLSHQIAIANGAVLLARQQRDAALAGLSRIAKYPLTRADELSAEQMRDLALNYHAKGLGCCQYCGGSGDVHGLDGEWRGECTECDAAAKAQEVQP
jgi:hypothetical protein